MSKQRGVGNEQQSRVDMRNEQAERMWIIPENLGRERFYFRLQIVFLKYTLIVSFALMTMWKHESDV